ncbi:MAG: hypothetical protein FJ087_10700 [Deltaproteobacteria bacterium]|nr:hypothetical protein [Deltaproteobacteria bacterium]
MTDAKQDRNHSSARLSTTTWDTAGTAVLSGRNGGGQEHADEQACAHEQSTYQPARLTVLLFRMAVPQPRNESGGKEGRAGCLGKDGLCASERWPSPKQRCDENKDCTDVRQNEEPRNVPSPMLNPELLTRPPVEVKHDALEKSLQKSISRGVRARNPAKSYGPIYPPRTVSGPFGGSCRGVKIDAVGKTGFCLSGKCAFTTCDDGLQLGTETDVDCGGGCAKCAKGRKCNVNADCLSGVCSASKTCAAGPCDNGKPDAGETDVDCGGPCGATCRPLATCTGNGDCASGTCSGGKDGREGLAVAPRVASRTTISPAGQCRSGVVRLIVIQPAFDGTRRDMQRTPACRRLDCLEVQPVDAPGAYERLDFGDDLRVEDLFDNASENKGLKLHDRYA